MTAEQEISKKDIAPTGRFSLWPWLAGAAGLLVYLFTLNHWVTLSSLSQLATLTGWDWHPAYLDWRPVSVAPLTFLATYPLRWLPVAWQPIGLNAISALCAGLTLVLLARSVRLLPQDRTREQRRREPGEFALLSTKTWWVPPALATAALAFQLTFWEHATSGTGEMLNLLIFAWLIRSLLEYRISENEKWLSGFALVYGAGMANNWAMIGFFPFFLIAVVWIKGLSFFHWRFLLRTTLWGLAGLSFYLLLPLIGVATGQSEFWSALQGHLKQQKFMLTLIPRWVPLLLSLPSLMALFFAGIRWPSLEGDVNNFAKVLTNSMLHLIHLAFWGFGIWFFFDYKFSPRVLLPPIPFLTFYYMAALSVGYSSGYLLLVFGKSMVHSSRRRRGFLPKMLDSGVVGLVCAALVAVPAALVTRNLPAIQAHNGAGLKTFAREISSSLPATRAIVLADSPLQLNLLRAAAAAGPRPAPHLFLDTSCLAHAEYLAYLSAHSPEVRKIISSPKSLPSVLPSGEVVGLLYELRKQLPIYYAHPSFGYYFEYFYAKPQGLVYEMIPSSEGVLSAPPLSPQDIQKNQDFWARLNRGAVASFLALPKKSEDLAWVADCYSTALNYWGVELQKQNHLKEAAAQFDTALRLNKDNFVAQANQRFNERLQAGNTEAVDCSDLLSKALSRHRGWTAVLKANGPADEPGLALQTGQLFAQANNLHQAAAIFQRRLQLQPKDLSTRFDLAKTHVDLGQSDKALEIIHALSSTVSPEARPELARIEALAWLGKKEHSKAEQVLQSCRQEKPGDPARLAALVDFYRFTGYDALRNGQTDIARQRFTQAIAHIDQQLQLDPKFAADNLMRKAQLQIQLTEYGKAVATLSQILQQQPSHEEALLNRAIAALLDKKYPEAKRDYLALEKLGSTRPYAIYFGLGEIALAQSNKAEAIKNYRLYLKSAPQNSQEYAQITQRLRKLELGL